MQNLFSLNFWFNLRPGQLATVSQNILIILIAIFAITAGLSFALKKNKRNLYFKFWERVFSFSTTNTFIGLMLWFFNYEGVPFFSARFWFPLWIIGIGVWKYFIFKYYRSIPERKKEIEKEKAYKKYLP